METIQESARDCVAIPARRQPVRVQMLRSLVPAFSGIASYIVAVLGHLNADVR